MVVFSVIFQNLPFQVAEIFIHPLVHLQTDSFGECRSAVITVD